MTYRKMRCRLTKKNAQQERYAWTGLMFRGLSIDENDLPEQALAESKRTFRSIKIDDNEFEFSGGFTDLHTASYDSILQGHGFGLDETRRSIDLVSSVRSHK